MCCGNFRLSASFAIGRPGWERGSHECESLRSEPARKQEQVVFWWFSGGLCLSFVVRCTENVTTIFFQMPSEPPWSRRDGWSDRHLVQDPSWNRSCPGRLDGGLSSLFCYQTVIKLANDFRALDFVWVSWNTCSCICILLYTFMIYIYIYIYLIISE